MKRSRVALSLSLAAAVLAPGCMRGRPSEPPRELRTAFAYEVGSLDPHLENSLESFEQVSSVYEPLVGVDRQLRLVPTLAVSWSNPDTMTWSFQLRPGVSFHDGSPLTAADVVYTLTRLRTDDTLAARSSLAEVTETRIESGRVVLRTARPSARFVYDLTKVLIVRAGSTRASLEARPNGTGPYAVESFAPGRRLRLRRHEAYWGPKPVFPRVDIEMNADEQTRLALLAGDFPVILRGRLAAAEQAASEGSRYRVVRQPSLYLFVLGLNVSSPTIPGSAGVPNPFRHREVRRAIHLALDRVRIAAAVSPHAIPSSHIVPSSVFGSDPHAPTTSRDVGEARRLLEKAGYRNGLDVSLHAVSAPSLPQVAELKAQLAEVGIRVSVEDRSTSDFYAGLRRQEFGLWLVGEGSDTGEAGGLLARSFHSPDPARQLGTDNFGVYANREVDRAIEEADAILDPHERQRALQRAVRLVEEQRWWIPLYRGQVPFIVDRTLAFEPRQDLLLRYAEIGGP